MTRQRGATRLVARDDNDAGVGYFLPAFIVLLAATGLACLSLLVDGGRVSAARRDADQVSFQAARAAAQALDEGLLHTGEVVITDAARQAAVDTVTALLERARLTGRLTNLTVDQRRRVTVTITIDEHLTTAKVFGRAVVTVNGSGTARVGAGVTGEETELP